MALLRIEDISLSVGTFPLLDNVNLQIENRERVALIGRNGEGKSTLLKIIAGQEAPDSGRVDRLGDIEVALLDQALPPADDKTVYQVVAAGLGDLSELIQIYHDLTTQEERMSDPRWLSELNAVQTDIEHKGGWAVHQRIERILTELNLPENAKMSDLSGGWRRRVAIAQVLVREPDLLLLDEPTNHLDLAAIQWLEQLLLNYPKSILFITHDRALLKKIATRIIDLDRGQITSYPPDYETYLQRKQKALEDEATHHAQFDKVLAKEEAWIRQGIKARRTRNEGRVRALKALREERTKRRVALESPTFASNESATQQGKLIFEAKDLCFRHQPDKPLIERFSHVVQRGDKVALVGENGAGKTTLIRLLMGELTPESGHVKQSPTNQIVYFDQNRHQIDLNKSLVDNVAEGDDFVELGGQRKHVIGYLGDFLFSPEKARGLARALSGGECNRLLLAKLFSKPSNVLVLDEPTNDLDIESLEVLENLILTYQGTVIIISHDRAFIDNVVTHSIVFSGNGNIETFVGGYTDWQTQKQQKVQKNTPSKKESVPQKSAKSTPEKAKKKLSYHEMRELDALPQKIEKLESAVADLQAEMSAPSFYQKSAAEIKDATTKLADLQADLNTAYTRWETLDSQS